MIMTVLKYLIGLVLFVSVTFFLLGLKSQKGKAPGLVDGKLAPCPAKPNCVSSEANTQPEKQIAPLSGSLADAKAAIIATGGTITSESDNYVSATYMTKVFKFVDDVEIRDAGNNTVHIRSGSRVGYSDRGVNRRRVKEIRAAMGQRG